MLFNGYSKVKNFLDYLNDAEIYAKLAFFNLLSKKCNALGIRITLENGTANLPIQPTNPNKEILKK